MQGAASGFAHGKISFWEGAVPPAARRAWSDTTPLCGGGRNYGGIKLRGTDRTALIRLRSKRPERRNLTGDEEASGSPAWG